MMLTMKGSKPLGFGGVSMLAIVVIILTAVPPFLPAAFALPSALPNSTTVGRRPGANTRMPTVPFENQPSALNMARGGGGEALTEAEEQPTGFRKVFYNLKEPLSTTFYLMGKGFAVSEAAYGAAMVLYGRNFPAQMHILTIGRAGGYDKIRRTFKASVKGTISGVKTALFCSPSLAFGVAAVKNSVKRKELADQYVKEHTQAMKDGKITKDEAKKLIKIQKKQIKLENRGIRRVKSARNYFLRVSSNLNLREIKEIIGDTTLMLTAILASTQPSFIGKTVFAYYATLNMGSLLLETNEKIGFPWSQKVVATSYLFDDNRELIKEDKKKHFNYVSPVTKFLIDKAPFLTGDKDSEEVAAEELAFVKAIGAMFTYGLSAYIMAFHGKLGLRLNSSLTASAVMMRGISGLCNKEDDDEDKVKDPDHPTGPGRLRGMNGGILTLSLTAISLFAGILLENDKLCVPTFWKPLTTLDGIVKKELMLIDAVV